MSEKSNLVINENDVVLDKLRAGSVELIHYARNVVMNYVNIVQI